MKKTEELIYNSYEQNYKNYVYLSNRSDRKKRNKFLITNLIHQQKEIKIHSQSIKSINYLPLLGSKKPLNNQDLNNKNANINLNDYIFDKNNYQREILFRERQELIKDIKKEKDKTHSIEKIFEESLKQRKYGSKQFEKHLNIIQEENEDLEINNFSSQKIKENKNIFTPKFADKIITNNNEFDFHNFTFGKYDNNSDKKIKNLEEEEKNNLINGITEISNENKINTNDLIVSAINYNYQTI